MTHINIAILGVTGHIAKAVAYLFAKEHTLYLFSRDVPRAQKHLQSYFGDGVAGMLFCPYETFEKNEYDVVFNCIGIGGANDFEKDFQRIYALSEAYDNRIIEYLCTMRENQNAYPLYVNFSSGAVYGQNFSACADDNKQASFDINHFDIGQHYCLSKLYSEAKHRAYPDLNIVDIRVFGFFSRFIDLKQRFLLTELINCIKNKEVFITNRTDIMRDYIHLEDFKLLLESVFNHKPLNTSIDLRSRRPVGKFEIIHFFESHYQLKHKILETAHVDSVTGVKLNYYSKRGIATNFEPKYDSMKTIEHETSFLMKGEV